MEPYFFRKNWAKHTKDPYISDLVYNGLYLDISLQWGRGSHPLSAKETHDISLKIQKLLSKKKRKKVIIVGSIPEAGELFSGIFTRGNKSAIKEWS